MGVPMADPSFREPSIHADDEAGLGGRSGMIDGGRCWAPDREPVGRAEFRVLPAGERPGHRR
jgi:hypothetical protein